LRDLEAIAPQQRVALDAALQTHEQLLVNSLVARLQDEPAFQHLGLPAPAIIAMVTQSLLAALSSVLLLGLTSPLEELARWQATLLQNRGVAQPGQATRHFLEQFSETVRTSIPLTPELRPLADQLMLAMQAAFETAYTDKSDSTTP
jgi:hypothetical protein